MKHQLFFFLFCIGIISSCQKDNKNYEAELAKGAFLVEVKVPAGKAVGQSFLPYPGNLAAVVNKLDTEVLVLSEAVKKGSKMPVHPIATLILKENNQNRHVIIATPADTLDKLTNTLVFEEFIVENAGEKQIIQDWFLYQKGLGKVQLVGWKDEKYAQNLLAQD
jgi:inorganic pyrophosphatase